MSHLFEDATPPEVKNAKVSVETLFPHRKEIPRLTRCLQGLHLLTMSTPNGQKVQIMLEELKAIYGTEWTQTIMLAPSDYRSIGCH